MLRARLAAARARCARADTLREARPEAAPPHGALFTADEMQQHGLRLAAAHVLSPRRGPDRLLDRLRRDADAIARVCTLLGSRTDPERRVSPAGEWLLDNFHLIDEEVRTARRLLPDGYSRRLPRLDRDGRPWKARAHVLAQQVVAHTDGRLDLAALGRFLRAYQSVHPLRLSELWAVPILLRLALLEHLRRAADRVAESLVSRETADSWADRMIEAATQAPQELIGVVADMARSAPSLDAPFVAELSRRLHGRGQALALPLDWVAQRLSEQGQSVEHLLRAEAQSQAAAQVSVSNGIGGLRLLASTDWRDIVETLSGVDRTLREDPAEVYAGMDFATRDAYRHAVERIALISGSEELAVAQAAVALARDAAALPQSHVGWWLRGPGLRGLEHRAGVPETTPRRLQRWLAGRRFAAYAGGIIAVTAAGAAAGLVLLLFGGTGVQGGWALVAALTLPLLASQTAVTLVNALAMRLVPPCALPRMDFSDGIPEAHRTLVVVPTLLGCIEDIPPLVEALEIRHLANRDPQLRFALLTDFHDAAHEQLPGDVPLLDCAARAVDALNARYAGAPFHLMHRPRRWNPRQGVWMGHERKRGKLEAINRLLRGGGANEFCRLVGDSTALPSVRYVITLDADTQLPRDAARRFVAAMAHPLNSPVLGGLPQAPRVVAGHGILQPRVGSALPASGLTRYGRTFGGEPGIDPYTGAVSDAYQDLFHEGSFIGKGIYDVDVVRHVLEGRLPDDRVLSHDLLEGAYARSGLLSDVELAEHAPARYEVDARRHQRWIRGDWQIAAWVLPWVPAPDPRPGRAGATVCGRNPLSLLSRAKIADNLRRSMVPPALLGLLLLAWGGLAQPGLWTAVVIGLLLVPTGAALLTDLLRAPGAAGLRLQLRLAGAAARRHLAQAGYALMVLPHEVQYSLDAMARTLWRLHVSGRRLLEWQCSADVDRRHAGTALAALQHTAGQLAAGPALAVATWMALALWRPEALSTAQPVLLLWLLSPLLVWWIDQPLARPRAALADDERRTLRLLARRTWAFFETHVGAEDHHLPPDNLQLQPVARVAHRTSPTNIGLSLLATLAAHDFGWVGDAELIARTSATLDTLDALERRRGHWLNWYDTRTLQPLLPLYVSSVDSGNLAGHLLTLRAGLLERAAATVDPWRRLRALDEPLQLLAQACAPDDRGVQRFALAWTALKAAQGGDRAVPRDALAALERQALVLADGAGKGAGDGEAAFWARALHRQCLAALQALDPSPGGAAALAALAARAGALAAMDFRFLYDGSRDLLAIGWNADEDRLDDGRYDLLASEMRLGVFVAIAAGQLPQRAWFALGRRLATLGGRGVLLSWSGSMFEYLMPMLVMPGYDGTLLGEAIQGAVDRQVRYGRLRGVPWGISESGYHATDAQLNYQYRAFGVPGLGLRRGLAGDLVVAPYATVLALMVAPRAAVRNLSRLVAEGLGGRFGLYEAVDYTASRLPPGETRAVVRSYMAHHQGMSLLALASVLLQQPMQRRFAADPALHATLLLLQERVPRLRPHLPPMVERADFRGGEPDLAPPARVITTADTPHPQVQLLSNGRYHVMVTGAGGGYSRWHDTAITRWREDGTTDEWGSFCYLRDLDSGRVWSTTPQPVPVAPESFEAIFMEGRAEFRRRDDGIEAHTLVVVSPEDDFELRRLHLFNRSSRRRVLELTTYAEVVLAPQAADAAHPAFGKLFVQTECLTRPELIVCTRRARSADEQPPSMFHLVAVHGVASGPQSHETDRVRFVGRGRSVQSPAAMQTPGALSGTAGPVLDPVVATRCTVTLEAGQSVLVDVAFGAAHSREACIALAHRVMDRRLADRVLELAWIHGQVVLRQLNTGEAAAQTYARLAGRVIHAQPGLRAEASTLLANRRGQSGLWGYGISGDLPIVLLQIGDAANLELVRRAIQAHAWWRSKGLAVDLVIWNEEHDVYRQQLHEQIVGLIAGSVDAHLVERPGGIFVRHGEQIAREDRVLLQAVARVLLSDRCGTLEQQVAVTPSTPRHLPALKPTRAARAEAPPRPQPAANLAHFNGLGGFNADGCEYVIVTAGGRRPPAPWVNVIANPRFGTVVSEAGNAYTWCENAHELRLSPWHNDPITDGSGEAWYLRDEETGQVWSPLSEAAPVPGVGVIAAPPYTARHGFGYSQFEHCRLDVHSTVTVFVALDAAVKFVRLSLRNDGPDARRLSATACIEWVLGDLRERTAPHVTTEVASDHGALMARNRYSTEFGDWVAFLDVDPVDRAGGSFTGDRAEFIGRNGSLKRPAALGRERLSGRTGAGLDPCGAIQVVVHLAPGQTREVVFRMGMGRSDDEAGRLVREHRGAAHAAAALDAVQAHWRALLGTVQVRTPDATLDVLANGWLLYQTVACRLWARSGYYQSGGAWGFRDQLQDAMALVNAQPALLREQLLRCAERQFVPGDVQHWWHPPAGHGVRTRISDDLLWLPLALCRYVDATHDRSVLAQPVPFLDGPPVLPPDESRYDLPLRSAEVSSLYEHARRAVAHALVFGCHGLPLMGTGDWNDGMNRVGDQGRGESVWLGFFLCEVLRRFAPLARQCDDTLFAERCDAVRGHLAVCLNDAGWDGAWYRRAYFDNGAPLGSQAGTECRIDSISQSWAVLSGVADGHRARQAMLAVEQHLVHPADGLVRLLHPPFDGAGPSPGYIAGYLPGVRENGGQYTHAAIWAAMAFAALGDARRAWAVADLVNPLRHGNTAESVRTYQVEPYVMAADVYSQPPHLGRGGWSWYTGSAGWMYRLVVESLLGITLHGDETGARLELRPCIPDTWPGFEVDYRHRATRYRIVVSRGQILSLVVDGRPLPGSALPLADDGQNHEVALVLGPGPAA